MNNPRKIFREFNEEKLNQIRNHPYFEGNRQQIIEDADRFLMTSQLFQGQNLEKLFKSSDSAWCHNETVRILFHQFHLRFSSTLTEKKRKTPTTLA